MSSRTNSGLITCVGLRNYKSIAACSVALKPLTILVGPNGAGKSNFLDGLRFTAESLRYSLEHALRDRGGIDEVRRRSDDRADSFAVRIDVRDADAAGWYGFEIGATGKGRYVVRREECVVRSADPERRGFFRVRHGEAVVSSILHPPPNSGRDRLYLLPASAYPPFRPVYDALAAMGFYHLAPERIRELQARTPATSWSGPAGTSRASSTGFGRTRRPTRHASTNTCRQSFRAWWGWNPCRSVRG